MSTDLPKYESKIALRLIRKFFVCVLLFALACYLYVTTMDVIEPTRESKIYAIIILAVAFAVSVFSTGFVQLLVDRNWSGTIVSKNLRHGYIAQKALRLGRLIPVVYIDMIVLKDNGKKKKITYTSREMTLGYYNAGDKVVHLKGAKFLLRPDRRENEIICPLCANTLFSEQCYHCRIKFSTKTKFY